MRKGFGQLLGASPLSWSTHPPEKVVPTLSAQFSPACIRKGFGQLLTAFLRLLSPGDKMARAFDRP